MIEYRDDDRPQLTAAGTVEHLPTCQSPRLHRRDGIEHARLTCTTCGAVALVPMRREWTGGEP